MTEPTIDNETEERCYPLPGEKWTKSMLLPRLHVGTTYVIEVDGSRVQAVLIQITLGCGEFVEIGECVWSGGRTVKHHFLTWELMLEKPPCSPNETGFWKAESNA